MQHEVIIVGGSFAGLSAALQLARARRRILVVDSGQVGDGVTAGISAHQSLTLVQPTCR